MPIKKAIHLLYAPTDYCNMRCQYCYLGDLTEKKPDHKAVLHTLDFTLKALLERGYLPFNLSFHGGEVTTLPSATLDALFSIAAKHYQQHGEAIKAQGFQLNPLHIKTNLLNFQKHVPVFLKHQVSISGSVDLPLVLHGRLRRDKRGNSTLVRIRRNLQALASYPYHKKISCVVTRAHLAHIDGFIADIHYLHEELGLDMSRFNIMFGFDSPDSPANAETHMLSGTEQVAFYQRLKAAFAHTPLANAFKTDWFKEFTPEFCCSASNCGNKFFLLQSDGDVYACPRGQASSAYRYGNVFSDAIEEIIDHAWHVMERNENRLDIDPECAACAYMPYCHLGCPYVRESAKLTKSYTCLLQKQLYQDDPARYPPLAPERIASYNKVFFLRNNLKQLDTPHRQKQASITPELYSEENHLRAIIARDTNLQALYAEDLFYLQVDELEYPLHSAILKTENDLEVLSPQNRVYLKMREDIFSLASTELVNNYLHIMALRDTTVVYGDEQRHKQAHLFDYSLYQGAVLELAQQQQGYYCLEISAILQQHAALYQDGVRNNVFFTTKALREYHYKKHKNNAFYHLQAINLPFQNIEFLWQGAAI